MTRVAALLACLALLAAPGTARADDADVTAAVTRWSLKIAGPAKQLQTKLTAASTPAEALAFLRAFTTTATRGQKAIAGTDSLTARGARVRVLARDAFAQYAAAGNLLIQAVNDLRAGKERKVVEAKVNRAIARATSGSARLRTAAKLIPQLVGG